MNKDENKSIDEVLNELDTRAEKLTFEILKIIKTDGSEGRSVIEAMSLNDKIHVFKHYKFE